MNHAFPFTHITIVGLGLIGSSIARALHASGVKITITASDRNPLALQYAKEQGFVHKIEDNCAEAVRGADLVILCTPPSIMEEIAVQIKPNLQQGAIVTDTASVKESIMQAVSPHIPDGVSFIPAHPIAGSEQSGVKAGKADLFAGKRVTLTPLDIEDPAIARVAEFWQHLGASVEYMPPQVHDVVYAYVSHMPQWLAHSMRPIFEPYFAMRDQQPLFKRFTRLCYSDARLWEEIFAANKPNLEQALARYMIVLQQIRGELASQENQSITSLSEAEKLIIYTQALPQIISSCLISAIYQEERNSGFSFARYGGTGLKDFIAPMEEDPDKHLEFISNHAAHMVGALDLFIGVLTSHIVTKD